MNIIPVSNKQNSKETNLRALIQHNISSDKCLEANILKAIPYDFNMQKTKWKTDYYDNELPPLFKLFNYKHYQKKDQSVDKHHFLSPIDNEKPPKRFKSISHKRQIIHPLKYKTTSNIQPTIKISNKFTFNSFEVIRLKQHIFSMTTVSIKNILVHPHHMFSFFVNRTYRKQIPLYMRHRINWKFVEKKSEGFNFRWKYYAKRINWVDYKHDPKLPQEKLKMLNLFENYKEIGNKKKLFINMVKYCTKHNMNVFEFIPFTIVLTRQKTALHNLESLRQILNFTFNSNTIALAQNGNEILTTAPYLSYFKLDKEDYLTTTANKSIQSPMIYFPSTFLSPQNYWIIKPVDLYQGIGIKISNSITELEQHTHFLFTGMEKITSEEEEWYKNHPDAKKKKKKQYRAESIIIQKYLDSPLLYYKRKCDLRCFVLVDHCLNVFICREGYIKACSEEYNLASNDQYSHITNYSLQKHSAHFSKYEQSNELSYKQFKTSLIDSGADPGVYSKIMNRMKDLVEISMNCIGKRLKRNQQTLSFQIFGYDFIIDTKYNPWILEINYNPGLEISSELIGTIIPRMVDDAFRLTIDKIFDTVYDEKCYSSNHKNVYKSIYHLDGYSDNENVFEFICNINTE